MLESEPYVHVISLDFSKAFDVVDHSSLFGRLAAIPIADQVYNWLRDFFLNRAHCTKFQSKTSSQLSINASVVQGSALGPALFSIYTSDLSTTMPGNCLRKYADDAYMLVPASNSTTIDTELANVNRWCRDNKQKLKIGRAHV